MEPKLAAIAGPRQGTEVTLAARTTIGRDAANDFCLPSMWVSRRHCLIERSDQTVTISDLGSHNGTFVNGVPVRERLLRHGDEVRIGDSVFTVVLDDGEITPRGAPVDVADQDMTPGMTVELKASGLPAGEAAPPDTGRAERDLAALMRVAAAIHAVRGVEALQRALLEAVFDVVPAERGALLLPGGDPREVEAVFGLERGAAPGGAAVRVSRTIAQRVQRDGVSILSNDVRDSRDFAASASLSSANVHSVLAVPLSLGERVEGVLYLDSTRKEARFDRTHLELLTAVAEIAAVALEHARREEWLRDENDRLRQDAGLAHNMVGESPTMAAVLQFVGKVAPADSTVLITGESGTGKELVARAIHRNSARAERPFVPINCAALAETLLESEMFGHERGAFTGAVGQKKGKFEAADGGTLFLDEIGEMAPRLQAKLLRVLQERTFERVGGTRPLTVDVRVVAATNRDLREMTKTGAFRDDLFYRINVVAMELPPLRERIEDIPLLARYFALKYAGRCKRNITGISPEALARLRAYDWPGNVRELENAIERAVVLGSSDTLRPEDLPESVLESGSAGGVGAGAGATSAAAGYHDAILAAKKKLILDAFRDAGGNYVETARRLDVHPNYLHRLIRNMDLKGQLRK